jgi:hypothetical protein
MAVLDLTASDLEQKAKDYLNRLSGDYSSGNISSGDLEYYLSRFDKAASKGALVSYINDCDSWLSGQLVGKGFALSGVYPGRPTTQLVGFVPFDEALRILGRNPSNISGLI